jgi:hypothetical protein
VALLGWFYFLRRENVLNWFDDVGMDSFRRRLSGVNYRLLDRLSSVRDGVLRHFLLFSTLGHSSLPF